MMASAVCGSKPRTNDRALNARQPWLWREIVSRSAECLSLDVVLDPTTIALGG
jgi:hypothetical protein